MLDVVEGIGRVDRKANENDMCFAVGQWAQALVVFLSSGIPEGQLYRLAVYSAVGDVVFKDGWDISLGSNVSRGVSWVVEGDIPLESNLG